MHQSDLNSNRLNCRVVFLFLHLLLLLCKHVEIIFGQNVIEDGWELWKFLRRHTLGS